MSGQKFYMVHCSESGKTADQGKAHARKLGIYSRFTFGQSFSIKIPAEDDHKIRTLERIGYKVTESKPYIDTVDFPRQAKRAVNGTKQDDFYMGQICSDFAKKSA